MPLDPIDPGAMPLASVGLTSAQLRKLAEVADEHPYSVRIEELRDAYVRVVLIGPERDAVGERLLFPV